MNSFEQIRVVSAIADQNKVVFYKEDGDTVIIKQGDHRLMALLDEIIPITNRGEVAVVSLEKFSVYADFEKKTGGFMRMFKVAKNAISRFFGTANEEEITITRSEVVQGTPPSDTPPAPTLAPEEAGSSVKLAVSLPKEAPETTVHVDVVVKDQVEKVKMAVKPVEKADDLTSDETIVGIVGNTIIPNVDALYPLIKRAMQNQNTVALENFIKRVAEVSKTRMHSVVDLMRFIERSDLPLADDGSIIAYKMLKIIEGGNQSDPMNMVWADCHTGRVRQRIGSRVLLAEGLIDLNRRNECSNGLHIARRAYLATFGGTHCVICRINPEDVMVVPHNDANKVRVRQYEILGLLSPEAFSAVKANRPFTKDSEALKLVHAIMKGHHTPITEEVLLTKQHGYGVEITQLVPAPEAETLEAPEVVTEQDLEEAKPIVQDEQAPIINPRELNLKIDAHIKATKEEASLPVNVDNLVDEPDEGELEAASEMYEQVVDNLAAKPLPPKEEPVTTAASNPLEDLILDYQTAPEGNAKVDAARAIVNYKRSKKKSWAALNVIPDMADQISMDADMFTSEPKKVVPKPSGTKANKAPAPKKPAKKTVSAAEKKLEMNRQLALQLRLTENLTKAEISRRTGISPRSLDRLFDKNK